MSRRTIPNKILTAKEIASLIGKCEVIGNLNARAEFVCEAGFSEDGALVWAGKKIEDSESACTVVAKASIIVCRPELRSKLELDFEKTCLIIVSDPRKVFAELLLHLFRSHTSLELIHPTAQIAPGARIGKSVRIGAYSVIGECEIGDESSIGHHCVIHDNTQIGARVKILNNVTIGGEGFGFVKAEDGHYFRFPQIGNVIVSDNVEIGSGVCIDRGSLGSTKIGEGVKIDNLVHIAHNSVIGKHTLVIAQSMIGGSATLRENVWIAPGARVLNGVTVEAGATIGMGAVLLNDVPAGEVWVGCPAKKVR